MKKRVKALLLALVFLSVALTQNLYTGLTQIMGLENYQISNMPENATHIPAYPVILFDGYSIHDGMTMPHDALFSLQYTLENLYDYSETLSNGIIIQLPDLFVLYQNEYGGGSISSDNDELEFIIYNHNTIVIIKNQPPLPLLSIGAPGLISLTAEQEETFEEQEPEEQETEEMEEDPSEGQENDIPIVDPSPPIADIPLVDPSLPIADIPLVDPSLPIAEIYPFSISIEILANIDITYLLNSDDIYISEDNLIQIHIYCAREGAIAVYIEAPISEPPLDFTVFQHMDSPIWESPMPNRPLGSVHNYGLLVFGDLYMEKPGFFHSESGVMVRGNILMGRDNTLDFGGHHEGVGRPLPAHSVRLLVGGGINANHFDRPSNLDTDAIILHGGNLLLSDRLPPGQAISSQRPIQGHGFDWNSIPVAPAADVDRFFQQAYDDLVFLGRGFVSEAFLELPGVVSGTFEGNASWDDFRTISPPLGPPDDPHRYRYYTVVVTLFDEDAAYLGWGQDEYYSKPWLEFPEWFQGNFIINIPGSIRNTGGPGGVTRGHTVLGPTRLVMPGYTWTNPLPYDIYQFAREVSHRIIWNFVECNCGTTWLSDPETRYSIGIHSHLLIGNVLAPQSDFYATGGGSVNGELVVRNFIHYGEGYEMHTTSKINTGEYGDVDFALPGVPVWPEEELEEEQLDVITPEIPVVMPETEPDPITPEVPTVPPTDPEPEDPDVITPEIPVVIPETEPDAITPEIPTVPPIDPEPEDPDVITPEIPPVTPETPTDPITPEIPTVPSIDPDVITPEIPIITPPIHPITPEIPTVPPTDPEPETEPDGITPEIPPITPEVPTDPETDFEPEPDQITPEIPTVNIPRRPIFPAPVLPPSLRPSGEAPINEPIISQEETEKAEEIEEPTLDDDGTGEPLGGPGAPQGGQSESYDMPNPGSNPQTSDNQGPLNLTLSAVGLAMSLSAIAYILIKNHRARVFERKSMLYAENRRRSLMLLGIKED